jgi:hypothetical protein
MIHQVPLNDAPCDLKVPDDLKERFWYEAEQKRLCFDGFMSKATFDRLEKLSKDGHYQYALNELFRIAIPDKEANQLGKSKIVMIVVTLLGIVALAGLAGWLVLMFAG